MPRAPSSGSRPVSSWQRQTSLSVRKTSPCTTCPLGFSRDSSLGKKICVTASAHLAHCQPSEQILLISDSSNPESEPGSIFMSGVPAAERLQPYSASFTDLNPEATVRFTAGSKPRLTSKCPKVQLVPPKGEVRVCLPTWGPPNRLPEIPFQPNPKRVPRGSSKYPQNPNQARAGIPSVAPWGPGRSQRAAWLPNQRPSISKGLLHHFFFGGRVLFLWVGLKENQKEYVAILQCSKHFETTHQNLNSDSFRVAPTVQTRVPLFDYPEQ